MDYNKIYINSSNIIDNLESMYYKTDNIKLKNKILYEINKYKKLNEICLIKNPNIKENIIHKLSNDFLFIIKLNFINDENIVKNIIDLFDDNIKKFSSRKYLFYKNLLEKSENINEVQRLVSIACGKEMQIKYLTNSSGIKSEATKTNGVKQEEKKQEIKENKNNKITNLDELENLGLPINYIDE